MVSTPRFERGDLGSIPSRTMSGATRLAQSVERKTFNLVVVGSIPTSGDDVDKEAISL